MANALYGLGKQKLLTGSINLSSDTIKAALVSTAYAQNLTTDEFWSTVSASLLGTAATLATKTVTLGVFDADDVTYTAVAGGSTVEAVVIYKDTGLASTSPLIAYIDTISGFPLATNGGNIQLQWDAGAYKIFSL
jgi:hypothetical protein